MMYNSENKFKKRMRNKNLKNSGKSLWTARGKEIAPAELVRRGGGMTREFVGPASESCHTKNSHHSIISVYPFLFKSEEQRLKTEDRVDERESACISVDIGKNTFNWTSFYISQIRIYARQKKKGGSLRAVTALLALCLSFIYKKWLAVNSIKESRISSKRK